MISAYLWIQRSLQFFVSHVSCETHNRRLLSLSSCEIEMGESSDHLNWKLIQYSLINGSHTSQFDLKCARPVTPCIKNKQKPRLISCFLYFNLSRSQDFKTETTGDPFPASTGSAVITLCLTVYLKLNSGTYYFHEQWCVNLETVLGFQFSLLCNDTITTKWIIRYIEIGKKSNLLVNSNRFLGGGYLLCPPQTHGMTHTLLPNPTCGWRCWRAGEAMKVLLTRESVVCVDAHQPPLLLLFACLLSLWLDRFPVPERSTGRSEPY